MSGRSIKIFLVDGDPAGLRTVEVGLSTLKDGKNLAAWEREG
jgi:hypothetical protein